jgi:hypothetical protein
MTDVMTAAVRRGAGYGQNDGVVHPFIVPSPTKNRAEVIPNQIADWTTSHDLEISDDMAALVCGLLYDGHFSRRKS